MRAFALFSTREALWAGWKTSVHIRERTLQANFSDTLQDREIRSFLMRGKRRLNRVKPIVHGLTAFAQGRRIGCTRRR